MFNVINSITTQLFHSNTNIELSAILDNKFLSQDEKITQMKKLRFKYTERFYELLDSISKLVIEKNKLKTDSIAIIISAIPCRKLIGDIVYDSVKLRNIEKCISVIDSKIKSNDSENNYLQRQILDLTQKICTRIF